MKRRAAGGESPAARPSRSMIEFYPQIRSVHIAAIEFSGAWFLIRWIALLAGQSWPRWILARATGWTIDGTVLTAATMLWTILPGELFANHWLTVKLLFVCTYFAAGWSALQGGLAPRRRGWLGALALLAYAMAYGIARTHDPLGWLA